MHLPPPPATLPHQSQPASATISPELPGLQPPGCRVGRRCPAAPGLHFSPQPFQIDAYFGSALIAKLAIFFQRFVCDLIEFNR